MPEATDQQMQQYCDQRIRVRAEQSRSLVNALRDDKLAIEDPYSRAVGTGNWDDNRTDGPPRLLDETAITTYNAIISNLIAVIDGTLVQPGDDLAAVEAKLNQISANWPVFQAACVRPASN